MGKPTYQAASIVAPTVEAHFARHLAHARERGEQHLAPQPDAKTIEAIIDAAFWASFRPEEGRFPKISLAYLSPDQTRQPLLFERPLPLTRAVLTKLAQQSNVPKSTSVFGQLITNSRCGERLAVFPVIVSYSRTLSLVCS